MDLSDLRKAALEQLKGDSGNSQELRRQSPAELIHELRVHQAELEVQNEELRRTQLELEDCRDRFANLFDSAPVGYVTLDPANRILEANLTFAKLLGVDRGRIVGQPFSRYATPEDSTLLHRHLRGLGSAEKSTSCELSLQKQDDSPVLVRLDSIAVGDHSRSIAITVLSDDGELIRAKRDSDERLRVICHALPIPIAYADQTGTYQFNNAAHEEWFKISRESIIGRRVREVVGDEIYKQVAPPVERALGGRSCSCVVQFPAGGLGPRSVEVHYAPHFRGDEVVGFYELMFDISASLHLEAQQARRAVLETQLLELSKRQRAIFDSLMSGKSNKAIALELDVGARTVERERHDMLKQLGLESISEMLVRFSGLTAADVPSDGTS